MLYISSFKNYEEFQQIFGVRQFEGGKARNNKILLALLKDKELFKQSVRSGDLSLFAAKNLVDLRSIITKKLHKLFQVITLSQYIIYFWLLLRTAFHLHD